MRPIIMTLLIVLALIPEATMAARWNKSEVKVWDFTPQEWRPAVQATVDDFNANLPPSAPTLTYVPMGEMGCDQLPKQRKRGGISVCLGLAPEGRTYTEYVIIDGHIARALIGIDPTSWWQTPRAQLCHEFMHAVTDVPDNYAMPHPDDSCVQGNLDHLGAWDISYAAQVYGGSGHGNGQRRKHQSKHHN